MNTPCSSTVKSMHADFQQHIADILQCVFVIYQEIGRIQASNTKNNPYSYPNEPIGCALLYAWEQFSSANLINSVLQGLKFDLGFLLMPWKCDLHRQIEKEASCGIRFKGVKTQFLGQDQRNLTLTLIVQRSRLQPFPDKNQRWRPLWRGKVRIGNTFNCKNVKSICIRSFHFLKHTMPPCCNFSLFGAHS